MSGEDDPQRWLDEHGDALHAYAWSRVGDRQTAEDVVQDTLLSAWRARESFRGDASRRTWLIAILRRKILDARRKAARDVSLSVVDGPVGPTWFSPRGKWVDPPGGWAGDPSALAELTEFRGVLSACIDGLPPDQAEALKRRAVKGDSVEVCCKAMGISASNLGVRLHRARLALSRCLETKWFRAEKAGGGSGSAKKKG